MKNEETEKIPWYRYQMWCNISCSSLFGFSVGSVLTMIHYVKNDKRYKNHPNYYRRPFHGITHQDR